jgi:hypothetical protein
MKITPNSFIKQETYNASEELFEVVADRKGIRYEVRRPTSGSTVAELPCGLTPDCKQLANLLANAPDMLRAIEFVLENCVLDEQAVEVLEAVAVKARNY